jgi:predicted small secreted protein
MTRSGKWNFEMNRRLASITFTAALLGVLAACNTVEGAGRDIQSGGKAVSDTATTVQKKIAE